MPMYRMTWTEAAGSGDDYREFKMEQEVWAGDRETVRAVLGLEHRAGEFFQLFWQLEEAGCCPDFEPVSYGPILQTERRLTQVGWMKSPDTRSGWEPKYIAEYVPKECCCAKCQAVR